MSSLKINEKLNDHDVNMIVGLVEEYKKDISLCKGNDVIIFLGKSQSGKSTVYNSLAHGLLGYPEPAKDSAEDDSLNFDTETLDSEEPEHDPPLIPVVPDKNFPIAGTGDSFNSCTKFPCAYPLPDGKVFLDTRGFCDNRKDPISENAAAILTDMAVRMARSVRIVWLQPFHGFVNTASGDIENIGIIMNKVLYDGAPVLFLFNKEVIIPACPQKISKILYQAKLHDPRGKPEDDLWGKYSTIAMQRIKNRILLMEKSVKDNLTRTQKELHDRFANVLGTSDEETINKMMQEDPAYIDLLNVSSYLAFFTESRKENRIGFIDPKFQGSLLWLNTALNALPPAIVNKDDDDSKTRTKSLNFTDYCKELDGLKKKVEGRLTSVVALLKCCNCSMENPVSKSLIAEKVKSLNKDKIALDDINNNRNTKIHEETYLTGGLVAEIEEEEERIRQKQKELNDKIHNLENGDDHIEPVRFGNKCLWRRPVCPVRFNDEKFYEFKEYFDDNTKRLTITSATNPFYAEYTAVDCYFWSRTSCGGVINFKITSKEHNKQLIESTKRELQVQENNLHTVTKDVMKRKGMKELPDIINDMIQRKMDETVKIEKMIQIAEKLRDILEEKFRIPVGSADSDKDDEMTIELEMKKIIAGFKPVITDFFQEKDGIMGEFLRVVDIFFDHYNHASEISTKNNIFTAFNTLQGFAEELDKYYPGFSNIKEVPFSQIVEDQKEEKEDFVEKVEEEKKEQEVIEQEQEQENREE